MIGMKRLVKGLSIGPLALTLFFPWAGMRKAEAKRVKTLLRNRGRGEILTFVLPTP